MESDLKVVEDDDVVITTVGRYKTSLYLTAFLLTLFISWPIIYLLFWTYQPKWAFSKDAFIYTFANGSGQANTSDKGNLNNTLLTDKGREQILWISLGFSFIPVFVVILFLYFYIN